MQVDHANILKQRALRLAAPKSDQGDAPGQASGESLHIVEFLLFPEIYAVSLEYVKEVFPLKDLCHVPGSAAHVMGLVNYRGDIMAVIDLKQVFRLKEKGLTEMNRVLLLEGPEMSLGLVADRVLGSKKISAGDVMAPPAHLSARGEDFIRGVCPEGSILLKAESLLRAGSL